MTAQTRILGIDPGSRVTGWGIVDSDGRRSVYVASGCIRTVDPGGDPALPGRLKAIFEGVRALVLDYRPAAVAVERVFMHRNADSALKLGQARSAAICATFGGDVEVHEYAARAVKQAIVGTGGADKSQVGHMVGVLLNRREPMDEDEADALAVALCHAHTSPLKSRLAVVVPVRRARSVRRVPL